MKSNINRKRNQRRLRAQNKTSRRRRRSERTVSQPVARSKQVINRGALRSLTITHKEYVRDVVKLTGVDNYIIEINPGLKASFPWLSSIANNFETYRFLKFEVEFIPNVGTQTNGAIALVPDYDPADDNSASSKSKLFAYEDSVRSPLWQGARMKCSARNLAKMKSFFIRSGPLSANLDIKTYDTLQYITRLTGATGDTIYGELWFHYTVVLQTPQIEADVPTQWVLPSQPIKYNAPFETLHGQIGNLAKTLGIVEEDEDTLGFRKAGKFLWELKSRLYPDSGDDPLVHVTDPGGGFDESYLVNATFEDVGAYSEYSETWLLQCPTWSESRPPADGINMTWPGWSGLTVDPLSTNLFIAIYEVASDVYNAYKNLSSTKEESKKLAGTLLQKGAKVGSFFSQLKPPKKKQKLKENKL